MVQTGTYNMSVEVGMPYEQTREKVIAALKEEGFGVLTEIDVKATLKQKLNEEFRKYSILGACNPPLAHKALTAEVNIGVLLPCNVAVYETTAGKSMVVAIDPQVQLGKIGRTDMEGFAQEVRSRLLKVLNAVSA